MHHCIYIQCKCNDEPYNPTVFSVDIKNCNEKVNKRNQCLENYCELNDIHNQSKGFRHFPLAFVKGVVVDEVDMYTAVKNRGFFHDMYRTRMVISVGKVCAVCTTRRSEIFRKNCHRNHSIFSHFSARPRGNKNVATIQSATLLLLPMVLVE